MSLHKFDKDDSIYMQNGYLDRRDYLNSISEEYCVDPDTVFMLAGMLGPDEDFDGLLDNLEDIVLSE